MPLDARHVLLAPLLLTLVLSLGMEKPGSCGHEVTPDPDLAITFPPDGHFTNDPTITVTGTARRGGGTIADVRVNGVSVLPLAGDPQDGTWSREIPLDPGQIFNPVLAELTLSGGTVLRRRITIVAGDGVSTGFVDDGAFSPESIALRLNDSGLDAVEPAITSLVDVDINALLPPGTPVIENFCYIDTIFGCIARTDAIVSGNPPPEIDGVAIAVDSQAGHVDATVTLTDLFIKTDLTAVSCSVTVTADVTDIVGDYGLEPGLVDPAEIDVFQIGSTNVSFANFDDDTNCGGLLGGVLEFFLDLLVGDIQDIVEPAMEDFLNTPDLDGNTPVAGAVEVALAGIELTGPIGDAIGVTLDTELFAVSEDADGITLGSDGAFLADPTLAGTCFDDATGLEAQPPDPCNASDDPCPAGQSCQGPAGQCVTHPQAPDLVASYDVAEPFPTFGPLAPGGLPYDLGLCVSTSAFNQLLKSQVECGLLTTDVFELPGIGPLSGFIMSLLIPELAQFPLTTQYKLLVRPRLAAIVTGAPGPAGELAQLELFGLEIFLRDVPETLPPLMRFVVDATVGLDADLLNGEIAFTLSAPQPGSLGVTVLFNQIGAANEDLEELIAGLFTVALPQLAGALEGFPLPEFLGLQLGLVEADRSGDFLSLFLDLSQAP